MRLPSSEIPAPAPPRRIRARAVEPAALEIDDTPDAGASDFETPPANGPYRGTVPVRTLERGIGGEEMRLELAKRLVPGAVWRRGEQRVRIEKVVGIRVYARELSNGTARRVFDRGVFLSSSHPERP